MPKIVCYYKEFVFHEQGSEVVLLRLDTGNCLATYYDPFQCGASITAIYPMEDRIIVGYSNSRLTCFKILSKLPLWRLTLSSSVRDLHDATVRGFVAWEQVPVEPETSSTADSPRSNKTPPQSQKIVEPPEEPCPIKVLITFTRKIAIGIEVMSGRPLWSIKPSSNTINIYDLQLYKNRDIVVVFAVPVVNGLVPLGERSFNCPVAIYYRSQDVTSITNRSWTTPLPPYDTTVSSIEDSTFIPVLSSDIYIDMDTNIQSENLSCVKFFDNTLYCCTESTIQCFNVEESIAASANGRGGKVGSKLMATVSVNITDGDHDGVTNGGISCVDVNSSYVVIGLHNNYIYCFLNQVKHLLNPLVLNWYSKHYPSHEGREGITCVRLHSKNGLVFTSGWDHHIRSWYTDIYQQIVIGGGNGIPGTITRQGIPGHFDQQHDWVVRSFIFYNDNTLLSTGDDKRIRYWSLIPELWKTKKPYEIFIVATDSDCGISGSCRCTSSLSGSSTTGEYVYIGGCDEYGFHIQKWKLTYKPYSLHYNGLGGTGNTIGGTGNSIGGTGNHSSSYDYYENPNGSTIDEELRQRQLQQYKQEIKRQEQRYQWKTYLFGSCRPLDIAFNSHYVFVSTVNCSFFILNKLNGIIEKFVRPSNNWVVRILATESLIISITRRTYLDEITNLPKETHASLIDAWKLDDSNDYYHLNDGMSSHAGTSTAMGGISSPGGGGGGGIASDREIDEGLEKIWTEELKNLEKFARIINNDNCDILVLVNAANEVILLNAAIGIIQAIVHCQWPILSLSVLPIPIIISNNNSDKNIVWNNELIVTLDVLCESELSTTATTTIPASNSNSPGNDGVDTTRRVTSSIRSKLSQKRIPKMFKLDRMNTNTNSTSNERLLTGTTSYDQVEAGTATGISVGVGSSGVALSPDGLVTVSSRSDRSGEGGGNALHQYRLLEITHAIETLLLPSDDDVEDLQCSDCFFNGSSSNTGRLLLEFVIDKQSLISSILPSTSLTECCALLTSQLLGQKGHYAHHRPQTIRRLAYVVVAYDDILACGEYLAPVGTSNTTGTSLHALAKDPTIQLLWQQKIDLSTIPMLTTMGVTNQMIDDNEIDLTIDKLIIDSNDSLIFITIMQTIVIAFSLTDGQRVFALDHIHHHPIKHIVFVSDRRIESNTIDDDCNNTMIKSKYLITSSSLEFKAFDLPVLLQTMVPCCVFDSDAGDLQEYERNNSHSDGIGSNNGREEEKDNDSPPRKHGHHPFPKHQPSHRPSVDSGSNVSFADSSGIGSPASPSSSHGGNDIPTSSPILTKKGKITSSSNNYSITCIERITNCLSYYCCCLSACLCCISYTIVKRRCQQVFHQILVYRRLFDFLLTIVFMLINIFQITSFAFAKVPNIVTIAAYDTWQGILEGFQRWFAPNAIDDDDRITTSYSHDTSIVHESHQVSYEIQLFVYWGIMMAYMAWFFLHERIQWKAFKDPASVAATCSTIASYVIQIITGPLLIPILTACFQTARCVIHNNREKVLQEANGIGCESDYHFGIVIPSFVLMTVFLMQLMRVKASAGDNMEAVEVRKNLLDIRGDQRQIITQSHPLTVISYSYLVIDFVASIAFVVIEMFATLQIAVVLNAAVAVTQFLAVPLFLPYVDTLWNHIAFWSRLLITWHFAIAVVSAFYNDSHGSIAEDELVLILFWTELALAGTAVVMVLLRKRILL